MNRRSIYIIFGFLLGVTLVTCISVAGDNSGGNEDVQIGETVTSEKTLGNLLDDYKVYAMPLPQKLDFSNEPVPLNNLLVQESLDKEIHTNVYWHSNTFFYLKRAARYFPIIEPILKENGVPDDFKYLAVIESGLINATSPSGAKGFWQFMSKTATGYDLEISEDVDERNHLVKSTLAACEYLKEGYKKFGSWTLAAASYNMGKAGLESQLIKQQVSNYYDVLLNAETARYVYRILAVKCIFESPQSYGFNFTSDDLYQPFKTKVISVDSTIVDLVEFAKMNQTNYKTLKVLNPWLINDKLEVKNGVVYQIEIPEKGTGLDVVSMDAYNK